LDRETNQCKHYEHRPQMCRDFEMNSFHCRRLRKSQGFE
jgi:Fe-S-cluster containining protein